MLGLLGQDPLDFERLLRRLHAHETTLTCTTYKAKRRASTMQHTANCVKQHCVHASPQRFFARVETLYTCCTCDVFRQHARIGWMCLTMVPSLCSRRLPAAKGICAVLVASFVTPYYDGVIAQYDGVCERFTSASTRSFAASSGSAHRLSHQPCLHPS